MFESVRDIRGALQDAAARLEPELLRPSDAAELLAEYVRIQKISQGAVLRLTSRAADAQLWRKTGDKSPAEWIARQTGDSVVAGAAMLEAGKKLAALPECDEAVKAGSLSLRQAQEIASAAAENPRAQKQLLESAKTDGFAGLKDRCAKVKAAGCKDELEKAARIHRSRALRHFTDPEGAFCLQGRFAPQAGAGLLAALEPYKNRIFDDARRAKKSETQAAYLADALIALAEDSRSGAFGPPPMGVASNSNSSANEMLPGGSSGNGRHSASGGALGTNCSPRRKGPNAVVHVTVDYAALVRGRTEPGETCEIPGIGPIPVATARDLLNDAILRVLVLDGADIKAVCSAGRWIPSSVRTALEKRDPVCVVPGCECRYRLQIDHVHEFAKNGPTKLDNLARLCVTHHYLKTYKRWRLEGAPGDWRFVPPEESRPPPDHGSSDENSPRQARPALGQGQFSVANAGG